MTAAIRSKINRQNATHSTGPKTETGNDEETEAMIAQAAAWTAQANTFDKLTRYEGRISRQLLQYTKELHRIQTERQIAETKAITQQSASFRQTPQIHQVALTAQKTSVPNPCSSVTEFDLSR